MWGYLTGLGRWKIASAHGLGRIGKWLEIRIKSHHSRKYPNIYCTIIWPSTRTQHQVCRSFAATVGSWQSIPFGRRSGPSLGRTIADSRFLAQVPSSSF